MNYQRAYERLLATMHGIASCATQCEGCQMLRGIACVAVNEAVELLSVPAGTIVPPEAFERGLHADDVVIPVEGCRCSACKDCRAVERMLARVASTT